MRQSPLFLVAALLAFTMVVPAAAMAFEFDSSGSTKADGSARYVDPDEDPSLNLSSPQTSDSGQTGSTSSGVTLAPGLFLNGSVSGNGSTAGGTSFGLQPMGRLTH
jgi:hypothetical protein